MNLDELVLSKGHHEGYKSYCAMDAVSVLLAVPQALTWSEAVRIARARGHVVTDQPPGVCPAVAWMTLALNDALDDDHRGVLVDLLPAIAQRRPRRRSRGYAAVDYAFRTVAPEVLDDLGLAEILRGLPEITDRASARAAYRVAAEVMTKTRDQDVLAHRAITMLTRTMMGEG